MWNIGDNEVYEYVVLFGKVGYLKNDMFYEDFCDLFYWIERYNCYFNWEVWVYYNVLSG